jgi:3-hydroxyisobutyrate dehydrogenase-like beta-hydroxyacid dehydrogenase
MSDLQRVQALQEMAARIAGLGAITGEREAAKLANGNVVATAAAAAGHALEKGEGSGIRTEGVVNGHR